MAAAAAASTAVERPMLAPESREGARKQPWSHLQGRGGDESENRAGVGEKQWRGRVNKHCVILSPPRCAVQKKSPRGRLSLGTICRTRRWWTGFRGRLRRQNAWDEAPRRLRQSRARTCSRPAPRRPASCCNADVKYVYFIVQQIARRTLFTIMVFSWYMMLHPDNSWPCCS